MYLQKEKRGNGYKLYEKILNAKNKWTTKYIGYITLEEMRYFIEKIKKEKESLG